MHHEFVMIEKMPEKSLKFYQYKYNFSWVNFWTSQTHTFLGEVGSSELIFLFHQSLMIVGNGIFASCVWCSIRVGFCQNIFAPLFGVCCR